MPIKIYNQTNFERTSCEAKRTDCEVTPNEWSVSGMNAVKHCRNDRGVKLK